MRSKPEMEIIEAQSNSRNFSSLQTNKSCKSFGMKIERRYLVSHGDGNKCISNNMIGKIEISAPGPIAASNLWYKYVYNWGNLFFRYYYEYKNYENYLVKKSKDDFIQRRWIWKVRSETCETPKIRRISAE